MREHVSTERQRIAGTLDRAKRGLILTTDLHEIWVIETEDQVDALLGSKVIVDGVITGIDRLRADWIGPI
jgi:hypothetical protein